MNDILEAVRNALATWLQAKLSPAWSGLDVRKDWPDAQQDLPAYTITVLATGDAENVEYFNPIDVQVVPLASPSVNGTVTYVYGKIEGLPLQLDVFASSKAARDLFLVAVRKQLFVSPQVSLFGTSHQPAWSPDYEIGTDLVLELPDLFNVLCVYNFSPIGVPMESSEQAETAEWRATFRGSADVFLTNQEQVPLIKQMHLIISLNGQDPETKTVTP
jgi:hypothetical protein